MGALLSQWSGLFPPDLNAGYIQPTVLSNTFFTQVSCTRPEKVYYSHMPEKKDTVPRLHQLVPHMRAQLIGLKHGATFEEARQRYLETVERLEAEGLGRKTASRVGDQDAYWSPTTEALEEAMRLGLVERQPLPSARRYLNAYRDTFFVLTPDGLEAAELAEKNPADFFDRLSKAVVTGHPYFKGLLDVLRTAPLLCPEVSEGDVEASRHDGRGTDHWAAWAADKINSGPYSPGVTVDAVKEDMKAVARRFGKKPSVRPPSKDLAEAINDAFAAASLRSRGLPIGATDLLVLKKWGSQLLLLDESRYVPKFSGSNVIWIAADIQETEDDLQIARRGLANYGESVAKAIVDAYREQARASESNLAAPYLPIYRVRAQAAFSTGVTRALTDRVLEQLAAGGFPDLGMRVYLHLGRGDQPPRSEPPYRRGGSRRYEMTMTHSNETAERSNS
jgi:hypothetical protein